MPPFVAEGQTHNPTPSTGSSFCDTHGGHRCVRDGGRDRHFGRTGPVRREMETQAGSVGGGTREGERGGTWERDTGDGRGTRVGQEDREGEGSGSRAKGARGVEERRGVRGRGTRGSRGARQPEGAGVCLPPRGREGCRVRLCRGGPLICSADERPGPPLLSGPEEETSTLSETFPRLDLGNR